jgi:MFS family permease
MAADTIPASSPPPEDNFDAYESLRLPAFRVFLAARFISILGFLIQSLAVGWLIYQQTHDPLSLGFIGLAEAVPAIGVALYAGHIADLFNRKHIVMLAVTGVTLSTLGLYFYVVAPSLIGIVPDYRIVYGLIFFTGLCRGFFTPAMFGLMAQVVPRRLYPNAASWSSSTWQTAALTGPAVGGILFGFVGPAYTFIICTLVLASFLPLMLLIKLQPLPKLERKASMYDSIVEGLNFVFKNQIFVGALALDLFAVLLGGAEAMLPVFASEVLHVGPEGLGLLRSAPAVGAVLIGVWLAHHPIRRAYGAKLLWAIAGFGLTIALFGLSTSFWLSMVLLAIGGAFDNVSVVIRSTIIQTLTPDHMRGRVSAVNSIFIGSSNELGEFESGVMAKAFGLVRSVVVGGCLTLGVVGYTALTAKKLRTLDRVGE